MNTRITILGVILVVSCVFGLFQVKYKVHNLKRDLYEINRQLAEDKEAIKVLKAEWAYLNKPERIEKLVMKYLTLENIQVAQFYRDDQLDNVYLASNSKDSAGTATTPVLKPILSSARGYR